MIANRRKASNASYLPLLTLAAATLTSAFFTAPAQAQNDNSTPIQPSINAQQPVFENPAADKEKFWDQLGAFAGRSTERAVNAYKNYVDRYKDSSKATDAAIKDFFAEAVTAVKNEKDITIATQDGSQTMPQNLLSLTQGPNEALGAAFAADFFQSHRLWPDQMKQKPKNAQEWVALVVKDPRFNLNSFNSAYRLYITEAHSALSMLKNSQVSFTNVLKSFKETERLVKHPSAVRKLPAPTELDQTRTYFETTQQWKNSLTIHRRYVHGLKKAASSIMLQRIQVGGMLMSRPAIDGPSPR